MFRLVPVFTLIAGVLLLGACAMDQVSSIGPQAAIKDPPRANRLPPAQPALTKKQPKVQLAVPLVPSAPVKPRAEEAKPPTPSDAQVVLAILRNSRAAYPDSCPCPYDPDRDGNACGGRSAYSQPRGYVLLCYEQDVTPVMIEAYRKRMH